LALHLRLLCLLLLALYLYLPLRLLRLLLDLLLALELRLLRLGLLRLALSTVALILLRARYFGSACDQGGPERKCSCFSSQPIVVHLSSLLCIPNQIAPVHRATYVPDRNFM
jgi:hypothetical protein